VFSQSPPTGPPAREYDSLREFVLFRRLYFFGNARLDTENCKAACVRSAVNFDSSRQSLHHEMFFAGRLSTDPPRVVHTGRIPADVPKVDDCNKGYGLRVKLWSALRIAGDDESKSLCSASWESASGMLLGFRGAIFSGNRFFLAHVRAALRGAVALRSHHPASPHLFMGKNTDSLYGPAGLFATDSIHQDVDMVTLRLNYKFGGPVVAKY